MTQHVLAESIEFFDTNDGGHGETTGLTVLGDELLFFTNDGIHGLELWKTEGTQVPLLVKDIYLGENSSYIKSPPIVFNDKLLFFADDGVHGVGLWESNGTEQGTQLIKSFTSDITYGYYLIQHNGLLLFKLSDSSTWTSDGTGIGTKLAGDLADFPSKHYIKLENTILFSGLRYVNGQSSGWELFKTNGTEVGTQLVKDIEAGSNSSSPNNFVHFNNAVYFWASGNLWKTDGTEAGTVNIANHYGNHIRGMYAVNGQLVYFISNGEVWSTNAESSPQRLGIFASWATGMLEAEVINDTLFFVAEHSQQLAGTGIELWQTDGSLAGTKLLKDLLPGTTTINYRTYPLSSNPSLLTPINDLLFFTGQTNTSEYSFGRSDGSAAGTYFSSPDIDYSPVYATDFTLYQDRIYFRASSVQNNISAELAYLNLNSILYVQSTGISDVPITASLAEFSGTTDYFINNIDPTTHLMLSAPASVGFFNFSYWSACDTTEGLDCLINFQENRAPMSHYTLSHYDLRVNASHASNVQLSAFPFSYEGNTNTTGYIKSNISHGTEIILSAPALQGGQKFVRWTGCDTHYGYNCSFIMTANRSVNAEYISTPAEDNYEPNNTLADAYNLTNKNAQWLATVNGIGIQRDDDWYKINVPTGQERLMIDLLFQQDDGVIYVELVDSSGTLLASSHDTSNIQTIDYTVPSAGSYYIRTLIAYGGGGSYDLRWRTFSPEKVLPLDRDHEFGTNGVTKTFFYDNSYTKSAERIQDISIAQDGSIIVLGDTQHTYTSTGSTSHYFPILSRYNADGTLDLSFGNNGKSDAFKSGSWNVYAKGVGLNQSTGQIFVGLNRASGNDAIEIDTLPANGSQVTQHSIFANFIEPSIESWTEGMQWLVTRDNQPIVGGWTASITGSSADDEPTALIIDPANTPMQYAVEFGGNNTDEFYAAAIQTDDKLLTVGVARWREDGMPEVENDWALARFNPNGSLDSTFGIGGKVQLSMSNGTGDTLLSVALQSDGKIIVRGNIRRESSIYSTGSAIARFNSDGTVDSSFGTAGFVFFKDHSISSKILIQADDKILFVKDSSPYRLQRLNKNGTLDMDFGAGGQGLVISSDSAVRPKTMQLQSDGKVVIAGDYLASSTDIDFWLARYHIFTETKNTCQNTDLHINNIDYSEKERLQSGGILQTNNRVTILNAADITFAASQKIILKAGFHARAGSLFTAHITAVNCL
ncbi:MAG: pre-peptidase C-terminal domain-containing protein [Methyloprofundus sp.]|nr:pre-peptidase C-terminal domain-containing protein [Methyloprofundus sp.]